MQIEPLDVRHPELTWLAWGGPILCLVSSPQHFEAKWVEYLYWKLMCEALNLVSVALQASSIADQPNGTKS